MLADFARRLKGFSRLAVFGLRGGWWGRCGAVGFHVPDACMAGLLFTFKVLQESQFGCKVTLFQLDGVLGVLECA